MTLSKERLEQFIRQPLENGLTRGEVMQLAKMMINQDDWNAAQQKVIADLRVQLERRERDKQQPVAWIVHARTGDQLTQDGGYVANAEGMGGISSTPLYAAPPAPVVTAEPVRYMNRFTGACYALDQQPDAATDTAVYVPLFAAPQPVAVPVVNLPPEFYSSEGVVVQLEKVMAALAVCGIKYERKGNACRAAMLNGGKL